MHEDTIRSPRDAAVAYARCGLSVLPWSYDEGRKKPCVKWREMQRTPWTTDDAERWWSRNPSHNVGVITGAISNLVVVDCDNEQAIAWADANLPDTDWRVTTGRGVQLGYRAPADGSEVRNRTKIGGMELDLRGEGGYVSMPPSVHRTGARYQWQRGPQHHAVVWLPHFEPAWMPQPPAVAPRIPPPWSGTERAGSNAAAWMRHRDPAVQGQGGHDHAVKTAWALASMGLDWSQAWPLYERWNATCLPPFSEGELARMLLSALDRA